MKHCPLCREQIQDDAIKCRHCSSLLVTITEPPNSSEKNRVTYILDRDLVRFGKFAGGVLGVFLVVGAFFFGVKLDNALDKVRDTQDRLTKAQSELIQSQKDLETAQKTVNDLKKDVQRVLGEATSHLSAISQQKQLAVEIVVAMTNQRRLNEDGQARLAAARNESPDKFRQTSLGAKLWKNGTTIRIRFLNGSSVLHQKVKAVAQEWIRDANLTFQFVDQGDAELRISFQEEGAWSFRGTDCLGVPQNQPTMNYGWLTAETDPAEIRALVLREFGHALGLVNEHQNPNANLPWDTKAVYAAMRGAPNFWDKSQVDFQILHKYESDELPDYRAYDPTSIMMMPFPKSYFTKSDFEIKRPMDLSASDRLLIERLYPKNE